MAVWKTKCGGAEILIKNMDHLPPHCHVKHGGRDVKVRLHDLRPWGTSELPSGVRKCLREHQEDMLAAWDTVKVIPAGKAWEFED
ncbi:MAG TPA: DUF4160 domain-containing protein [Nitrospirales bacterium]|jgi:hypothetical protein|nr:DUF4160 domain-containing protein [Nitrospirales bacterium]